MKHIPNAIGGEMEGWVLLELKRTLKGQHNKHIEVIVIKGVAGYSDLSKEDKDTTLYTTSLSPAP